jgi:hypothetical protein
MDKVPNHQAVDLMTIMPPRAGHRLPGPHPGDTRAHHHHRRQPEKERAGPWLSGILADTLGIRPMFGVTAFACLAIGLFLIRLLPQKE